MTACFLHCFLCHDYRQCQMTVIEVKENGAIRTKMLSCDSPFCVSCARCSAITYLFGRSFEKYLEIYRDNNNTQK